MRSCILPANGHSTLVYDYREALAAGIDPRAIVVDHLGFLRST